MDGYEQNDVWISEIIGEDRMTLRVCSDGIPTKKEAFVSQCIFTLPNLEPTSRWDTEDVLA